MKRVLFVIPGLGHGGTNRSMKNLIGQIGNGDIDIEILALCGEGIYRDDFEKYLQNSAQAITEALGTLGKRRAKESLLSYLWRVWWKLIYVGLLRRSNEKLNALIGKRLKKINYDMVIAFQESAATGLAIHIPANRHIAWVRCDYENYVNSKKHFESEEPIYAQYDKIVCVSGYTAQVFRDFYPNLKDKVLHIYNMIDDRGIIASSKEKITDDRFVRDGIMLVSVGRFAKEKRFALIPGMCVELKKRGVRFKWYLIGDHGDEKPVILERIKEYGVEDSLILLGEKANPYPYIAQADILVCTSYTEACPNVVNEAKILHVPVVAADFPSAYEFINHGENGFIVPVEEMASVLIDLCEKKEKLKKVKDGISGFVYDNAQIKKQISELIMRG